MYLLQFKHLLTSGVILIVAISSSMNFAYGHGCQGPDCFRSWSVGILSTYAEVITIVSDVGFVLAGAMLIFKFDYLQRKDFHVVKYSPTRDRINRILFEGRNKRKIIAAMPFLAFGDLLLVVSLQTLITYGYKEYETCSSYLTPFCQTTTYADSAFFVILHSLPFIGGGMFLLVTGLKAISVVTMKKEAIC